MASGGADRGGLNPGALVLGITALIGVLGSFTVTGTIGRVLRNEPTALTAALVLVLLGAAAFAAAALPLTGGVVESVLTAWGIALTGVGILVGVAAGVRTMDDVERPAVTAKLEVEGLRLQGAVKVSNLRSTGRLTVLVDGLRTRRGGDGYDPTTVHYAFVGPDADGKVDLDIDVRMPPGRFDSIGVKAWTSEGTEGTPAAQRPCEEYPRRVSSGRGTEAAETGCTVLPLPPVPTSPRLALSWMGDDQEEHRLRVAVAVDNAPVRLYALEGTCPGETPACAPHDPGKLVALTVTGRTLKRTSVTLYRALLRPDVRGHLRTVAEIPVRTTNFDLICAQATLVTGPGFPVTRCEADRNELGRTVAELRPTPPRKNTDGKELRRLTG